MHETVLGSAPVRRVARGSVTAFAIIAAGVGLTYCSQLLIARVVGVDMYGIYAYVIAWIGVLAYFSALGFDVALLRFVPAYHAEKSWALLRGVVQYAQRRAILVGEHVYHRLNNDPTLGSSVDPLLCRPRVWGGRVRCGA
jgi:hypothetical protein